MPNGRNPEVPRPILSVPNRSLHSPWEACRTVRPSLRADGRPYGDQNKGQVLCGNHTLLVDHRTLQVSFPHVPSWGVVTWGDDRRVPHDAAGSVNVLRGMRGALLCGVHRGHSDRHVARSGHRDRDDRPEHTYRHEHICHPDDHLGGRRRDDSYRWGPARIRRKT